ncbi:hypothetical protein AC578_4977 [Pseudocercospora eumusae]|uniref:Uncharacterized protein n=1 Tax=Pseudocercospora eumusae TaxID=321146 RepID=A0A139H946_9PEZI|nr:hypothetical protein AC578_4977 [Pseudocercospora eumusae]
MPRRSSNIESDASNSTSSSSDSETSQRLFRECNCKYVLVYVRANGSASIQERAKLDRLRTSEFLWVGEVSKNPLKSYQEVRVPHRRRGSWSSDAPDVSDGHSADECDYPVVVYSRLGKNMRRRRMSGEVGQIVALDNPID